LVTLPELASDGGFFIFMFWYFHRGLEPHLQRAHAGHTQGHWTERGRAASVSNANADGRPRRSVLPFAM
jgi:hypothetical protein